MTRSKAVLGAAALVAAIVIAGIYSLSAGSPLVQSTTNSGTGSYSVQGGNVTIVATQAGTMTRYSSSISASTSTTSGTSTSSTTSGSSSSSTSSSQGPSGSYTYTPSAQVKILSVAALVSKGPSGGEALGFRVTFENVGGGPITVVAGGGSSLNATITSGSAQVSQVAGMKCEIATAMVTVASGQSFTSATPGCWSGFSWQVVQPGTIQVDFTLSWGGSGSAGSTPGSVEIAAQFTLS
jgi:hypothetical protein